MLWFPLFWVYGISINATPDIEPPKYVGIIVVGLFMAFTSFAFVRLYFLVKENKKKAVDFWIQDKVYIVLSLTSKIALHWTLFFGVLQRSRITGEEHEPTAEDDATEDVIIVVAATFGIGLILTVVLLCCPCNNGYMRVTL